MYPIFQYEPTIEELNPNPKNIVRAMGYINGDMPDAYKTILDDLFQQARKIITPKAGFTILPPSSSVFKPGKIILDEIVFNTEKIVAGPLKRMEQSILFAATVGPGFDDWSKSTFDGGDPLAGYIIDLLGSELAESIADWLEEKIVKQAKNDGLFCSNRYSPGYCGWSVSEQHKLFGFFPENFCGIALTETALMKPHKSVSGIIGMGKHIKRKEYPCESCKVEHCYKNHPA